MGGKSADASVYFAKSPGCHPERRVESVHLVTTLPPHLLNPV